MTKQTISGTLVRSRTPGPRGGTTNTLTDRSRLHSITWIDYENFHTGDIEVYQNVSATIEMDMSKAKLSKAGQRS